MGRPLVYLAGPPGSGKTTLMAALTASCSAEQEDSPMPHLRLSRDDRHVAVELGRRRENFSGTDALAMNISPTAIGWVGSGLPETPLLLAEGDRLATFGFLAAAEKGGYDPVVLALVAPRHVLDQRCAQRGSLQDPSWRAGRATKCARLYGYAESHGWPVWYLASQDSPDLMLEFAVERVPALGELM